LGCPYCDAQPGNGVPHRRTVRAGHLKGIHGHKDRCRAAADLGWKHATVQSDKGSLAGRNYWRPLWIDFASDCRDAEMTEMRLHPSRGASPDGVGGTSRDDEDFERSDMFEDRLSCPLTSTRAEIEVSDVRVPAYDERLDPAGTGSPRAAPGRPGNGASRSSGVRAVGWRAW
jgi:hypothetical protein